jgi:hypothetical protein
LEPYGAASTPTTLYDEEPAIPAMVITTAAVAGTAAVNFLAAIRR